LTKNLKGRDHLGEMSDDVGGIVDMNLR